MPNKLTTEQFITKAKQVHGDIYNYSKVCYVNNKTKVVILCKKHGKFLQTPNNHLNYGCKFCGGTTKSNTSSFIEKANLTHNYFYDYSKVTYSKSSDKVSIICPVHGLFYQEANTHLQGSGCNNCCNEQKTGKYNIKIAERNKKVFLKTKATLYLAELYLEDTIVIKIGVTCDRLKTRFLKIGKKYRILDKITSNLYDSILRENYLLNKFYEPISLNNRFSGYTECMSYNKLEEINKQFKKLKNDKS